MGFTLEPMEQKQQEQTVSGRYRKVAVGCWFTSKGKSMPKLVRYEDEDGCRHLIYGIQVLQSEKKYYAGILMQKYDCRVEINGISRDFVLLFHPEENTWDIVLDEDYS